MAKIRNLYYQGAQVEQPVYQGVNLTKWIHDGVVVWEDGGLDPLTSSYWFRQSGNSGLFLKLDVDNDVVEYGISSGSYPSVFQSFQWNPYLIFNSGATRRINYMLAAEPGVYKDSGLNFTSETMSVVWTVDTGIVYANTNTKNFYYIDTTGGDHTTWTETLIYSGYSGGITKRTGYDRYPDGIVFVDTTNRKINALSIDGILTEVAAYVSSGDGLQMINHLPIAKIKNRYCIWTYKQETVTEEGKSVTVRTVRCLNSNSLSGSWSDTMVVAGISESWVPLNYSAIGVKQFPAVDYSIFEWMIYSGTGSQWSCCYTTDGHTIHVNYEAKTYYFDINPINTTDSYTTVRRTQLTRSTESTTYNLGPNFSNTINAEAYGNGNPIIWLNPETGLFEKSSLEYYCYSNYTVLHPQFREPIKSKGKAIAIKNGYTGPITWADVTQKEE